jgi:hypothetical protein
MKKIVACLTVSLFLVMIPLMSSAKKPLTEKEMDTTTAQEGVSIEFGGASYSTSHFVAGFDPPDVQSWGEADGCATCGGYTSAGWVGMRDMTMDAGANIIFYNTMTIDVGTSGSVTKTVINPGTILVHPVGTNATVAMGTDQTLAGTQVLGRYYNDKFAIIVNALGNGYMQIGNHSATGSGEGVEIGFKGTLPGWWGALYGTGGEGMVFAIPNSRIDQSWGDMNGDQSGATSYTDAGYFGARDMYVAPGAEGSANMYFVVSGTMDIDVGSDASKTAVVIGLPKVQFINYSAADGTTNISGITVPLVFATSRDLDTNTQALGTLYTQGISMSPSGSLTISAHQ